MSTPASSQRSGTPKTLCCVSASDGQPHPLSAFQAGSLRDVAWGERSGLQASPLIYGPVASSVQGFGKRPILLACKYDPEALAFPMTPAIICS